MATVLAVGPAAAGARALPAREPGVPDVAVVIAGSTGRTVAVRSGDPVFARLWQVLQPLHTRTERVPEDWAQGRFPPVRFTVVWGLSGVGGWPATSRPPGGDVAVERQDQLVVAPDGTPWVRSDPAPAVEDDDIRWHRAPRSALRRIGLAPLLGGAADGSDGSAGAAAGAGGGAVRDDVRWAVAGLVAGLAAGVGGTVLVRRAAARREAGPPREEPRRVLYDLDE
ncbi:hypothetical protein ACH4C6_04025 [Streptomyces sp. NPDC017943]|uniref:hypothetical protein n=1 Tax=Streptomyces sp. NPDC017943 TaxID=3365019 RepID=UPI0037A20A14